MGTIELDNDLSERVLSISERTDKTTQHPQDRNLDLYWLCHHRQDTDEMVNKASPTVAVMIHAKLIYLAAEKTKLQEKLFKHGLQKTRSRPLYDL